MAIDLNLAPEHGGGEDIPDLNEALWDDDDQLHPVQEDDHTDPAIGEENQRHVYLFDLNVDEWEDQEEIQQDDHAVLDYDQEAMDFAVYSDGVDILFDEEELDNSSDQQDEHEIGNIHQSKNLTDGQRQAIYKDLLKRSKNGILEKYSTRIIAEKFQVSMHAVQRVWKRAKQCLADGIAVDVGSRKRLKCGRKKIEINLSQIAAVPMQNRGTIRGLADGISVSKSTVHRRFKEGVLRRHSNSLKPYLREENKKERLRWCVSMLDGRTLPSEPKFVEMKNIIHIDEKWFNATKKTRNIYLHPGEEEPYYTVQNKNAIDKVMFLAAVAKPRYNEEGICTFDGKIGIWPFIRKEPAQRSSRNRERGTLVTKPIKVDRDTIRSFLITKVLPAIIARCPREDPHMPIWIQQDNARTHLLVDDYQFAQAVSQTGLNIYLMNQPPNSPDMNALDLGFFASLQSLTQKRICRNMDEVIENVEKEYGDYDAGNLRRVFITLQSCLIEIMDVSGENKYKIPHMNKGRLEALGILPNRLSCTRLLYERVMATLHN